MLGPLNYQPKKEITVSKKNAKIAPEKDVAQAEAPGAEPKVVVPKTRGPRGTEESAKITVLAKENPKRAGSKAAAVFAQYKDGMTIKEFCDAVGKEATGHLVYDAKHGSIAIEGYDPGAIVVAKVKEPKAPKVAKEPKAKKTKVDPSGTVDENKAALEAETAQETME